MNRKISWVDGKVIAVALLLTLGSMGSALAQHAGSHGGGGGGGHLSGGANQHLDGRFAHNQYYYNRGYTVDRRPTGGMGEFHGADGSRYWLHGGHWYRWGNGGWVVWGAPLGLFIPYLPFHFTTVWWNGIPYYYANDTYYQWNDGQYEYEVVAPPDGIESGGSTQGPSSNEPIIYPKSGQSADQQQKDRYECHSWAVWAVGQSGFDPTAAGGNVAASEAAAKRNSYFRAQAACLEGRGYTVK